MAQYLKTLNNTGVTASTADWQNWNDLWSPCSIWIKLFECTHITWCCTTQNQFGMLATKKLSQKQERNS